MRLGILSDTHDKLDITQQAVAELQRRGVGFIVHCGDLCSAYIVDALAGIPSAFVFGNCDWDRQSLARYAESVGVQCLGTGGVLELAGKRVGVVHGDLDRETRRLLVDEEVDYLLCGHTHLIRDERSGKTRIINPGALHRAARKTAATLDLATDTLERFAVDEVSFVRGRES